MAGGRDLFYRRSRGPADAVPILHVHGFAISGAYLMPTAERLAGRGVNIVPDLPGLRPQRRRDRTLDIPDARRAVLALLDALDLDEGRAARQLDGLPGQPRGGARRTRARRPARARLAGGRRAQPAAAPGARRSSPATASARRRGWPGSRCPTTCGSGRSAGCGCSTELTLFPSLERLLHTPVPDPGRARRAATR